jgi:hypothetical protein
MPEYLAPGVYVEETSFRSKSIEGQSTTTTGFVGPTRYGPVDLESDIITSLGEFERIYGDGQQLDFNGSKLHNYVWHAARAFFTEGGKRLYIGRVFHPRGDDDDGRASGKITDPNDSNHAIQIFARYPGEAGNQRVRFTLRLGQNVLSFDRAGNARVSALVDRDVVLIGQPASPLQSPLTLGDFYLAHWNRELRTWNFESALDGGAERGLASLQPDDEVRVVSLVISAAPADDSAPPLFWDVALDKDHQRDGAADSMAYRLGQAGQGSNAFGIDPKDRQHARAIPIVVTQPAGDDGTALLALLFAAKSGLREAVENPRSSEEARTIEVVLKDGNDGLRPEAEDYAGKEDLVTSAKTGLVQFEDLDDISIVAAPGATFGYEDSQTRKDEADAVIGHLIIHATRMRYRIAVLDSGNAQSIGDVRKMRGAIDSTYAALYYPWIRVLDPITRAPIYLPPSGFVAGIYARNDINRAVYKAPANEVVNLASGFEVMLNKAQQDVLNPEGINCFRFFEGRGYRLWGARTISSDPEWKYVNLRRYFAYLERSIDKGTQWAVFEPNGELLWANVRRTIEDFLLSEWQSGALLGDKPEKAFFVKCDRSTMTQNDLDNGRLVCLIGVAALRPAEFVIFRIGQWTGDRKG